MQFGKCLSFVWRWHNFIRIMRAYPPNHLAFGEHACDDGCCSGLMSAEDGFFAVHSKARFEFASIRAMTCKAVFRKNGPNIAIEFDNLAASNLAADKQKKRSKRERRRNMQHEIHR